MPEAIATYSRLVNELTISRIAGVMLESC